MNNLSEKKVILGLSGGVDSTAAALLLKEKGFDVTGLYFDVTGNNTKGTEEAKKIAQQLGIGFIYKDVSKRFSDIVISNFCSEYKHGRTPNPCIICNPNIKFKILTETADEEGAYYIATGHYTRVVENQQTGIFYIMRGTNEKKDQSYMMYRLGQSVLSRLILPLGDVSDKNITRDIARSNSLSNADAADSQEICFIDYEKDDHVSFIQKTGFIPQKGSFIDSEGNILGEHKGLLNYTVGQRKGLGIALGKPAFVTEINPEKNTVTLGSNEDLFKRKVYSENNFFTETSGAAFPFKSSEGIRVKAKIRYAARPADAVIRPYNDGIITEFAELQRAPTPGQSVVFYQGDYLIGGGIIK